jgi:hypothetical protein
MPVRFRLAQPVTFNATEPWKASPMTYMVSGRQHIAIASGGNILSFALGDSFHVQ